MTLSLPLPAFVCDHLPTNTPKTQAIFEHRPQAALMFETTFVNPGRQNGQVFTGHILTMDDPQDPKARIHLPDACAARLWRAQEALWREHVSWPLMKDFERKHPDLFAGEPELTWTLTASGRMVHNPQTGIMDEDSYAFQDFLQDWQRVFEDNTLDEDDALWILQDHIQPALKKGSFGILLLHPSALDTAHTRAQTHKNSLRLVQEATRNLKTVLDIAGAKQLLPHISLTPPVWNA